MITAHAPSGYVLGRLLPDDRRLFWAAFCGAVVPDLDMIWFYLIDDRALHHHRYWVHAPGFWILVAAGVLPLLWAVRRSWVAPALAGLAGVFCHLCLDTIAGQIMWAWPFSTKFYQLLTVPAVHDDWVLNFILHPVFLLELLIWAAALLLWIKK